MGLNEKFFKSAAGEVVAADNFNTVIYTGDGSTKPITSLNFAPDLIWIKERSGTDRHVLIDTIRGTNSQLSSQDANAETTYSSNLVSFDTNGFTLGSASETNGSNETYVAWNWYAPTSQSIGASGSRLASTIKKNVTAGFSIVSYAGASNSTADTSNNSGAYWSVGHGLDATPDLVIVKKTNAAGGWYVGGAALGSTGANGNHLVLNTLAAQVGEANILWGGSQTFNDTTFGIGGWDVVNRNGDSYIAYCFHSVDGYSKIDTYEGKGSSTRTVETGFTPSFLLIKNADAGNSWVIFDNKRSTSNTRDEALFPNDSGAEYDYGNSGVNFNSTSFSLTVNAGEVNSLNKTYIYLAIA